MESLETRQMLATLYVNDDWDLTEDNGAAGLSTEDVVTDANDSGQVVAAFGENAYGTVLRGQDNFDDGNDDESPAWQRISPLADFGAPINVSFPNGGYRLLAPASPNPEQLGAGRGGAALPGDLHNFEVSVDLVDFDPNLDHAFGLLVRITEQGLGATDGYALTYDTGGNDLNLSILTNEAPDELAIADLPVLDPANDYRFVFQGDGTLLSGRFYQLPNLQAPLAEVFANDATYPIGEVGLVVADLSDAGNGTSDATFDNMRSTEFLTNTQLINDALDDAQVDDTVLLLPGFYNEDIFILRQITLAGSGRLEGSLVAGVGSNSTVAPGPGANRLQAGSLTMSRGTTLQIDLNGVTAGSEYDQIVAPSANLGTATLSISLGYQPQPGDSFVIIDNTGDGSVVSTFDGLAEGATVTVQGQDFQISYTGGDGNDVELTAVATVESVTVGASRDNSIFEEGSLSNGAGRYLFAGQTNGSNLRRGLIAFDIASAVPAGSTIVDAQLTLHMSKTRAGATLVALHRLTRDWGEGASNASGEEGRGATAQAGDATWTFSVLNVESWNTPGGDLDAAASATTNVNNIGSYSWSSPRMAADLQSWLDDPNSNFGWTVIGNESANLTAKRFDSRESPDVGFRPSLQISYQPGPPGGPTVDSLTINALEDPPDLPSGPQPSKWADQRSDVRQIEITFSEEVRPVVPGDLRLTNLGLDAPVDPDTVIALNESHISQVGNILTLSFSANELPDGVYSLEVLPTVVSLSGQALDGNADGAGGDAFLMEGDDVNKLYKLTADFNGDQGTSIFDFGTFAYWFGEPVGTAPKYVDLNDDEGVTIFDFGAFASNFGKGVKFLTPLNAVWWSPADETRAAPEQTENRSHSERVLNDLSFVAEQPARLSRLQATGLADELRRGQDARYTAEDAFWREFLRPSSQLDGIL